MKKQNQKKKEMVNVFVNVIAEIKANTADRSFLLCSITSVSGINSFQCC